jgi:hypothetical protein
MRADKTQDMQDLLFDPANEWHEYRGRQRLLRSRAVFAANMNFLFEEHPQLVEIQLIDLATASAADNNEDPTAVTAPTVAMMVAGYVVLSSRTTLGVFRSILPGATTRFFFLSLPLLERLRRRRKKNSAAPAWCAGALEAMRRLLESDSRVNKPHPGCARHG